MVASLGMSVKAHVEVLYSCYCAYIGVIYGFWYGRRVSYLAGLTALSILLPTLLVLL